MEGYRVEEMTPLKKCTKCGEEKPATREFFGFRRERGTLTSACKFCGNLGLKEARRKQKDNPKYKARRKESRRRTYLKHKESVLAKCREYYSHNKEKVKSRNSKWVKENADTAREYWRLYARSHRHLRREYNTAWQRGCIKALGDTYIKQLLASSTNSRSIKNFSQQDIDIKRAVVQLKRIINEKQRAIRS